VLRRWNIGSVPYLNAAPLIHGVESHIHLAEPSRLALSLRHGELDAALAPLFAVLEWPELRVVDGIAIACDGPVHSVILAHRHAEAARTDTFDGLAPGLPIITDPASRSSVNLLKVLWAETFGTGPNLVEHGDENAARLLIGDPANQFRRGAAAGWRFCDLGAVWKHQTGLPFVFAVWSVHPSVRDATELAALLRDLAKEGCAAIPEIARGKTDPEFARRYLEENVRFQLGPREKQAMQLFWQLCATHGIVQTTGEFNFV
jgi:chorismate dehydratase